MYISHTHTTHMHTYMSMPMSDHTHTHTPALLGEARTRVILKRKSEGFVVLRGARPTADDFSWACLPRISLAFVTGLSKHPVHR